MDPKRCSSTAFFLLINLVLFIFVNACAPPTPPHPKPTPPDPKPTPEPCSPPETSSCPRDALKLGVCANILSGTIGAIVGSPPDSECCSLLQGLVDLEVAICLCTALKANILGINLNIPIALSLLINTCGNNLPSDFQCA